MPNRKLVAVAGALALAVGLSACAESQRTPTTSAPQGTTGATAAPTDSGNANADATFIFGAAGAPKLFDPFYASDGETFRVTRQIYEQLLDFLPGEAKTGPGLAESYEGSEDGLTWTFKIREGVTFHDGTDLDAAAVCANFDRWYNQTGAAQSSAVTYYWNNNFGGFADQTDKDSLFESCTADGMTATVKVTRVTSKFPDILAHGAYAIQSPTAHEKYDANNVQAQGSGFTYPAYALEHPTGTGAFTFGGYDDAAGEVTLNRNEDYWGTKAGVAKMVIRTIPDESTRRQELQAGTIHGYDLPNPVDWKALEDGGAKVEIRPAFNILYVGLNATKNEALKDVRVRQALSYAINRDQLVQSQLPEGAEAASQFFPKAVSGYNTSLQPYPHDPEKAKALLAEAGHSDLTLEFWQPTEVTRPYMPDPASIYEAIRSDWEAVGVTINPVAKPWTGGYLDGTEQGEAPAFLLGWTGDYDSADNFIGTFFTKQDNAFATKNYPFAQELTDALVAADSEPDAAKRDQMVSDLNKKIAEEYLPGLPISHSPPAIVVAAGVEGLVTSPLAAEDFSTVTITE
ncbi:ABC transporter substrate-binding protein [Propioniciclava sp. MC1683]|uniref:ABC transporter substrate-binding protein n=1 Tax=Propioniciclava sp. MC1683 TaxID=2760309 RepID=UPI001600C96B|nr:ABC transporter substrate-binding protein [Propioniciclava sp. MC1683]MBB1499855.1 ABC transporter substrate-binding protein [Propioniciclava sp. MC1683]